MIITAEPRSDQWNADDFIGGARTFTIKSVQTGKAEQKYDIELVEGEGRSWRPPLTMLRLLIAAWGDDSTKWAGRQATLYRDDSVRFGSDAVGGIRISHMSHLPGEKPFTAMLTTTRGRRAKHTVQPLKAAPPTPVAKTLPAITPDAVEEFERDIAEAVNQATLDEIATQLKEWDLGSHREHLLSAWAARRDALQSEAAGTQAELGAE